MKDNQQKLHQDLQDWFVHADQTGFVGMSHDYHREVNKGHGRLEIRHCWVIDDSIAFEYIRHYEGWAGLRAIVRVKRERHHQDQVPMETAYYIPSLSADAKCILKATRQHWDIENQLHWVMDVTFNDDHIRARRGNSPQNMTLLRHIALNILKHDGSKGSLRQKRYRAALDDSFMHHLLTQV